MISEKDFIFNERTASVNNGSFQWSAPSNIALVKYWGKKEHQIPANPSISFTLNSCKTITKLSFEKKHEVSNFSFDLLFEGKPKEDFKPKIQKFFERIAIYCPYLTNFHFTIDTQNTFPHSSGIASSASGFGEAFVQAGGAQHHGIDGVTHSAGPRPGCRGRPASWRRAWLKRPAPAR